MNVENFQYSNTKIVALRLVDPHSVELADIFRHFRQHNYFNNPAKIHSKSIYSSTSVTSTTFINNNYHNEHNNINPTIVKDSINVSMNSILKIYFNF